MFYILLSLIALLPIFFLPSTFISIFAAKTIIISLATFLILIFFIIQKLKEPKVKISFNLINLGLILIPIAAILSGFFSNNKIVSFFGRDFSADNVLMFITLISLTFLISSIVNTEKKIFKIIIALVIGGTVSLIIFLVNLFGFQFLSQLNTLGSIADLSFFAGLILIIAIFALETLKIENKFFKIFLQISAIVSVGTLIIINNLILWIVLATISVLLFIHLLSKNKTKFPRLSLGFFVISFIFILSGGLLGQIIFNFTQLNFVDIRPSFLTTYELATEAIKTNPVLGYGPGRFDIFWNINRPLEVNSTPYWDYNFNYAYSFIFTFAITQGILGLLSWLFLFGVLTFYISKTLLKKKELSNLNLIIFASTLYLWVIAISNTPGLVLITLMFIFTGISLNILFQEKILNLKEYPLSKFTIVLVLILILSITALHQFLIKFSAEFLNSQSSARAYSLFSSDIYLRNIVSGEINNLNNILNNQELEQNDKAQMFRNSLTNAIIASQEAIKYDRFNYYNYFMLGNIYESVMTLGVEESYEEAIKYYNDSLKYRPDNPAVYLSLSRIEFSRENYDLAMRYIDQAINLKNNESSLYFQKGLIQYQKEDYKDAVVSFENAVILEPFYANAKYFLGLTYQKIDRLEDAVYQFEDLAILLPENQEIKNILENLKDGGVLAEINETPIETEEEL